MQLTNPPSVYWVLAQWLPIRLDYFAETMFIASFILAIIFSVIEDTFSLRKARDV